MKILALESSATACSAALWGEDGLIAQNFQNSGLTHSRTLLPMAHDLLKNCGVPLDQVDVIAVAAGPGSFTGLRIGVATAKGLSWGADKDCAACSTLESMAWPLTFYEDAVIVCAMDARRKQVYNALFQTGGEKLERLTPKSKNGKLSLETGPSCVIIPFERPGSSWSWPPSPCACRARGGWPGRRWSWPRPESWSKDRTWSRCTTACLRRSGNGWNGSGRAADPRK